MTSYFEITPEMLDDFRDKLKKNSFGLLFQPVISTQGDKNEDYEILFNPKDALDYCRSTSMLFSAAERDKDLAINLDRWIILQAIKRLAQHRTKNPLTRFFINLTSASVQDASLPEWLASSLTAHDLPPESLVFQISETDVSRYLSHVKTLSDALHAMGAAVCIKHFGCSPEPFRDLSHLGSVSFIKVDSGYMMDIKRGNKDTDALTTLIDKITKAGKKSIVPFVEESTMMAVLWQGGADFIQGHYIQKPSEDMTFIFEDE